MNRTFHPVEGCAEWEATKPYAYPQGTCGYVRDQWNVDLRRVGAILDITLSGTVDSLPRQVAGAIDACEAIYKAATARATP